MRRWIKWIRILLSRYVTMFTLQTDLGKRLYALRIKAITTGMKLLSEDEVLEKIKKIRAGEIKENE